MLFQKFAFKLFENVVLQGTTWIIRLENGFERKKIYFTFWEEVAVL